MLNMVRATLYRFARPRLMWGMLAAYVACIAVLAFVSAWLDSVDSAWLGGTATPQQVYGQTVGNVAVLFTCAIVASFVVDDFKTGAVKNVLQAKGGRVSYAASLLCTTLATVVAAIAAGIAATEVFFRLAGFSIEGYDAAGLGLWLLQVVVVTMAYLTIVLLLCLVTKSGGFVTFAIFLLCTGLLEGGAMLVLANAFDGVPALRDCMDNCLAMQLTRISAGTVPASFAADFLPGLAVIALFGLPCLAVMRKMDLK